MVQIAIDIIDLFTGTAEVWVADALVVLKGLL